MGVFFLGFRGIIDMRKGCRFTHEGTAGAMLLDGSDLISSWSKWVFSCVVIRRVAMIADSSEGAGPNVRLLIAKVYDPIQSFTMNLSMIVNGTVGRDYYRHSWSKTVWLGSAGTRERPRASGKLNGAFPSAARRPLPPHFHAGAFSLFFRVPRPFIATSR